MALFLMKENMEAILLKASKLLIFLLLFSVILCFGLSEKCFAVDNLNIQSLNSATTNNVNTTNKKFISEEAHVTYSSRSSNVLLNKEFIKQNYDITILSTINSIGATSLTSDDIIITEPTIIANQNMTISGNLIVLNSLSIINSTLCFNSTSTTLLFFKIESYVVIENSDIFVSNGNYELVIDENAERVEITDSNLYGFLAIVISSSRENVMINGSNIHNLNSGVTIYNAENVTLEGNHISSNMHGVLIQNSSYVTLTSNIIEMNTLYGLKSINSYNISVRSNVIQENQIGSYFIYSENITFSGNHISENTERGGVFENSTNLIIKDNIFENNEIFGLNIYNNSDVLVAENTFIKDQIWVMGSYEALLSKTAIENNFLNGKKIIFYVGIDNTNIEKQEIGQLIIAYCNNFVLKEVNCSAIQLYKASNISIVDSSFGNSDSAIVIWYSELVEIENSNITVSDLGGIRLFRSKNITVNEDVINNCGIGIFIAETSDVVVSSATIESNIYFDILLLSASNAWIINNEIKVSSEGVSIIDLLGSSYFENISISNNLIEGDATNNALFGIKVLLNEEESSIKNMVAKNNRIDNISHGTAVMPTKGIALNMTIYNNTISYSSGYGILLKGNIRNVNIAMNNVSESYRGIYMERINGSVVVRNVLHNNVYGIIVNESYDNLIYENCFLNNSIQAYNIGNNFWDNGSYGNFWDDYTGYDENNDGIGDVQYSIPENGTDNFPLIYCFILNDKSPPIIFLTASIMNNSIVSEDVIIITWNIVDKYFKKVDIYLNNSLMFTSKNPNESLLLPLSSEGQWNIKVVATDISNNTSCKIWVIYCDFTDPIINIITSIKNNTPTNERNVTLKWNIQDRYFDALDVFMNGTLIFSSDNITGSHNLIFSDGTWNVTVYVKDKARNSKTTTFIFVIDTKPPTICISSTIKNMSLLKEPNFLINWYVTDLYPANVSFFLDDTKIFSTSALSGSYFFNQTLAEGKYAIWVFARDLAGNLNRCILLFEVDITPPDLYITSTPKNQTIISNPQVEINWTVYDKHRWNITIFLNDTILGVWSTNGSITINLTYGEGMYFMKLVAFDEANNSRASFLIYELDRTAPILNITSFPNNNSFTSIQELQIFWLTEDEHFSSLSIYKNSTLEYVSTQLCGNYTLKLDVGYWIVLIKAEDAAHNICIIKLILHVIHTESRILIASSIKNGSVTNLPAITLSWFINDTIFKNLSIFMNGNLILQSQNRTGCLTIDLISEGRIIIELVAVNLLDNVSKSIITFDRDITPPTLNITTTFLNSSIINDISIGILWNCSDKHKWYLSIYVNNTLVNTWSSNESTILSLLNGDGIYIIKVSAHDDAGNTRKYIYLITVDTESPTMYIETSLGNNTYINTPIVNISWNAYDDHFSYIIILLNDSLIVSVNNMTGSHLVKIPNDGTWIVSIIGYDLAGNAIEKRIVLFIDTVSPSIKILAPKNPYINYTTVSISWISSDDWSGIDHYEIRVDYNNNWSYIGLESSYVFYNLSEGEHTIFVRCFDKAGNMNMTNITIIIDLTPPSIEMLSPANNTIINSRDNINILWKVNDNFEIDKITITVNNSKLDDFFTRSGSYNLTLIESGIYIIKIVAMDKAGNSAEACSIVHVIDINTTQEPMELYKSYIIITTSLASIISITAIVVYIKKRKRNIEKLVLFQ